MTIGDHLQALVAVAAMNDLIVIVQIVTMTETVQNVTGLRIGIEGINMTGVVIVTETHSDPGTRIGITGEETVKGAGETVMSTDDPAPDEAEAGAGARAGACISMVQILTIVLVHSEMKI